MAARFHQLLGDGGKEGEMLCKGKKVSLNGSQGKIEKPSGENMQAGLGNKDPMILDRMNEQHSGRKVVPTKERGTWKRKGGGGAKRPIMKQPGREMVTAGEKRHGEVHSDTTASSLKKIKMEKDLVTEATTPVVVRILSWNVQGFGTPGTFHTLKKILRKRKPELVFLMETRMTLAQMEKRHIQCGFHGGVTVGREGLGGGFMLMWAKGWQVQLLSYSQGHFQAHIKTPEGYSFNFTGFYGHPETT